MTSITTRAVCAGLALALAVAPVAAAAKAASSLNDLVGAKAAGAETDLESRGWVMTDGHKGSNASYTYWWNRSQKACVVVTTRDGRYAAITDGTPGDCNQKSSSNDSAAAAAVAGAAIAAILLAHKSGNHDSGQHYSESQKEADYERGYRDGLHNSAYSNRSKIESYSSGYQNGVEQRERELHESRNDSSNNNADSGYSSGYRNTGGGGTGGGSNANGGNYGGGSAEPVAFNDLVGDKAAGVETDLESRGFRNVDNFEAGNGKGTIWWNGRTRQCLQMITADGRADSISDIQTSPKCR